MAALRQIFEAYGGDYDVTMTRFMDSEELYIRLLAMLQAEESPAQLAAAVQQNDLDAAFEAAHALKGVAGNLGLTPLYNAVCAIVEPLRVREARDYTALCDTVQQEFRRACALSERLQGGAE